MRTNNLIQVTGIIREISPMGGSCNHFFISLNVSDNIVNIILTPGTYVVNNINLKSGMHMAAFYDGNAPAPLIFPPQFQALMIAPLETNETVTLRYFDKSLTASDQSLRLNIGPDTQVLTMNGQTYSCPPENKNLLVFYSITTRSIPPQTTPRQIIVMND